MKSRLFFDRMLGRGTVANGPSPSPVSRTRSSSHHRTRSLNPNAFLSRIPTKIASPPPSASRRRSMVVPPSIQEPHAEHTSNNLTKSERAEKVKRNRKVLQILGDGVLKRGTGPTGDIAFDQALNTVTNTRYHSPPSSPNVFDAKFVLHKRSSQLLVENRRHSSPITSTFSPETLIDSRILRCPQLDSQRYIRPVASHPPISAEIEVVTPKHSTNEVHPSDQPEQPTPLASEASTLAGLAPSLHSTDSSAEGGNGTILEDTTPELPNWTLEDQDRARKRATLAKLHRFLGSRVPVDLVLGLTQSEVEASLPPKESTQSVVEPDSGMARAKSLKSFRSQRLGKNRNSGGEAIGARAGLKEQDVGNRNPVTYVSDDGLEVRLGRLTHAERNHIVRKKKKITKVSGGLCILDQGVVLTSYALLDDGGLSTRYPHPTVVFDV